jgi:hypothetical protein
MANGVKFGRKSKLTAHQRTEAIKRRADGETLAAIAKSYAVDISVISRLPAEAGLTAARSERSGRHQEEPSVEPAAV